MREMWKKNPDLAIVYIGDTAHVPYGDREASEIREFAVGLVSKLKDRGADQIVCACNTSWGVARTILEPIWSVTEAGRTAAAGLKAGVLATTRTVESGVYGMPGQAVPGLVSLIEQGVWEGPEVEAVLAEPIRKLGAVQAVVLGCTHFPLVRGVVEKLMPGVRVVDPGEELAKQIGGENGPSKFLLTKQVPEYTVLAERILGKKVEFEVLID